MRGFHNHPRWAGPGAPHDAEEVHDGPGRGRWHPRHGGPGGPRGHGRRGGPFGGGDFGFGPGFGGPGGGPRGGRGGGFGPFDKGGPDFGGRGRGRGRGRRSRGDVRTAVLALLAEAPMHGYQIIQEISERSGGAWRPSPGSVYPTVSQLADEGLVHTEKSEGRSVVHLTEEGRRWVDEHREELDAVWTSVNADAEDGFDDLRSSGRGLMGAVMQVAQVGSAEQVAEAGRLLDETRRRLYLLLAGEAGGAGDDEGDGGDEPTDATAG